MISGIFVVLSVGAIDFFFEFLFIASSSMIQPYLGSTASLMHLILSVKKIYLIYIKFNNVLTHFVKHIKANFIYLPKRLYGDVPPVLSFECWSCFLSVDWRVLWISHYLRSSLLFLPYISVWFLKWRTYRSFLLKHFPTVWQRKEFVLGITKVDVHLKVDCKPFHILQRKTYQ